MRHTFYGGRTGTTCLYYKTNEAQGEKVHYIDVTSEHPWVNKYRTYLVGHPQILTSPQTTDLSDYYGITRVDIVPPEELFNPVILSRWRKIDFSIMLYLCGTTTTSKTDA